ncbi:hypothetical protein [Sphingopyxis sp. RIFCSPHIGHO2_12_FULL_65_19]|uniref:hypothetical protein n=1 Tax=Sphingopyxis sp. RIFCSPHIGHO2_12_FULL_65_19 TaxID=1802172 RepID=UPI0008B824A5|nr:hypothetical protein [Sphingopyxis sp. RIFCSPHIGHO2_12_FULL_65_19]OHD05588.1 MAG: hypothetical protein A3E77_14945 [Sphingopyxis sp. RIFCSPHIGHO2_12_FULL_65_19]
MKRLMVLLAIMVAGCSSAKDEAASATLYRNSILDPSMRVHFASFNAPDKAPFNIDNCEMVARIMNANVDASSAKEGKPRNQSAGFWCERGDFSEEGSVPRAFESEFPSDSAPYR